MSSAKVGPAFAVTQTRSRRNTLQPIRAFLREWPDPQFVEEVKEAFPDKGVATVEEARVCSARALKALLL